jgi:hypothetical protein
MEEENYYYYYYFKIAGYEASDCVIFSNPLLHSSYLSRYLTSLVTKGVAPVENPQRTVLFMRNASCRIMVARQHFLNLNSGLLDVCKINPHVWAIKMAFSHCNVNSLQLHKTAACR